MNRHMTVTKRIATTEHEWLDSCPKFLEARTNMPAADVARLERARLILTAIAGGMLFATLFTPWTARGNGSLASNGLLLANSLAADRKFLAALAVCGVAAAGGGLVALA